MKIKETLFSWLTHRYQLIVRDEENFAEKHPIAYTHAKLMAIVIPVLIVCLILGIWIGYTSASKISLDKNSEFKLRKEVVMLSVTVDSLTDALERNVQFIGDLKKVMKADNAALKGDTTRTNPKFKPDSINTDYLPPADIELRKEFEGSVKFTSNIGSNLGGDDITLRDIFFFPPLKGLISEKYNPKTKHYGTDIVTKKNEPIKCVADGTVILSSWTEDTGNIIAVQHKSNIISIYKHNSVLLKKVGEVVKAGEVIAIVGNTGKFTTGPHLHVELWYNGNPVNPEKFISF